MLSVVGSIPELGLGDPGSKPGARAYLLQHFVSKYDFSEFIDICDDIAITSRLVQWVSIPEFQLGDPGSIPGMGAYFLLNGYTSLNY